MTDSDALIIEKGRHLGYAILEETIARSEGVDEMNDEIDILQVACEFILATLAQNGEAQGGEIAEDVIDTICESIKFELEEIRSLERVFLKPKERPN